MKLSDFNLLDNKEEIDDLHAVIQGFNRNKSDYPKQRTVHSIFIEQAKKTPDAPAVIQEDKFLTYSELDKKSNKLARFLINCGLKEESFVGVMLDRSLEVVISILGIIKAGGAYLPLNPDLPFQRIKYMLCETNADILISEKRYIKELNKLQWECAGLRNIYCADSWDVLNVQEEMGGMMDQKVWDYVAEEAFDDISGGGWKSSYTGEWLSREVMDEYGENIRTKLAPYINKDTRILEIGCASGISMFRLAPMTAFYYGTDLSKGIIPWAEREMEKRGLDNIKLKCLAAHEIDQLEEDEFDVVVINSVIECFNGHNYLRDVIEKSIKLLGDSGILFLGNVWDQDRKEDFIKSLEGFRRKNKGKGYRTKLDRSEELYISKAFMDDLQYDFKEIVNIEYSEMLGSAESELSKYGYDVIAHINKKHNLEKPYESRNKYQYDQRALETLADSPLEERSRPDGLIYLIYTSGTSGLPKGVMIEHRSVLRLVLNTNYINLEETDRILQTGSLAFDASTFEIWGAILNGGAVCFLQEEDLLDAKELKRLIEYHGITTIFLTTGLFNILAGYNIKVFDGLKTLLTGGEKVSVQSVNKVRKTYPSLTLIHVYGPTENTTFTTGYHVENMYEIDIPIGKPIANTAVYILDKELKPVPVGVPGELCTGGDGIARGYFNDTVLTEEKFVHPPFDYGKRLYRTGDLARWTNDGNIEFIERIDDQVKIRGYRIELAEIEARILQHEEVKETVVIANDFGADSKELLAYLTGKTELDVNDVRDQLMRILPEYMIPAYFIKLDKLPLTPNGKVNKKDLPLPEVAYNVSDNNQEPLETETEKELALIWEEVLGHKVTGATDDFFESGGYSLKVTKLVALILKRMGVEVPIAIVFKMPTIRELAGYILDNARFGVKGIDDAMVLLSRKANETVPGEEKRRNIFAFPPGTGDALGYIQLADLFKPYFFYGFNFIEADSRINDYADLVMRVDPEGPYMFFGYSAGGNLAYHVAKELENRGLLVSDIVMVDSGQVKEKITFPDGEARRVAEKFLNHESVQPYLTSKVLREKAIRQIGSYYEYMSNIVDNHVVSANIHLIQREDPEEFYRDENGRILVSQKGWGEMTGGEFKMYKGFGDHNRMLYQPYLDQNLKILRNIFEKASAPVMG